MVVELHLTTKKHLKVVGVVLECGCLPWLLDPRVVVLRTSPSLA